MRRPPSIWRRSRTTPSIRACASATCAASDCSRAGKDLPCMARQCVALVDSLYETELIRKRWTLEELFAA